MKATVLLIGLFATSEAANHGEVCKVNGDCQKGLVCKWEDSLFKPRKICLCEENSIWNEGQCVEQESGEEDLAAIVTILVPVLSSVFVTIMLILGCCCWIQSSTMSIKTEMKKATAKEEFELEAPSPEPQFTDMQKEAVMPRPKTTENVVKISDNGQIHKPTSKSEAINGNIPLKKISDPGYQSNMRLLLQRPTTAGLSSRPNSANYFDNRPPTSISKPSSRTSSASSSRKSSSLNGPYLTEPSRFPRPRTPTLQNGHALTDMIVAVAEAEEKKDNFKITGDKAKEVSKKKEKRRKSSMDEIRLVRVAVDAFKKKRRLRDLKPRQRRRKTKFENVVDKVMRMREDEKKQLRKRSSTSSNTTASSSLSSSTEIRKRPTTSVVRPESVAQRVIRERQERKLPARVIETPSKRPKSTTSERQPLYKALRQSASKHHDPKAIMAHKIREQAHYNAVKNYEVPLVLNQAKDEPKLEQPREEKKIKSILKRDGQPSSNRKKSHVNYAFDFDEIPQRRPKEKQPRKISSRAKSATVVNKRTGRSRSVFVPPSSNNSEGQVKVTAQVH